MIDRVSTEFRRHGIPRNFLTSEVISAQFRRNSAKFRGIPRNFAGIAPEITSVFRGMPKCHFRGHPNDRDDILLLLKGNRRLSFIEGEKKVGLKWFEWNLSLHSTHLLLTCWSGAAAHWSDQNLLNKIRFWPAVCNRIASQAAGSGCPCKRRNTKWSRPLAPRLSNWFRKSLSSRYARTKQKPTVNRT